MKNLIYFFLLAAVACTENQKKGNHTSNPDTSSRLVREIDYSKDDSDKLAPFINEAKWLMYCIHCDSFPTWRPQYANFEKIPFSSMELKLIDISRLGDTVEFGCEFFYNDTIPCNINTISNYHRLLGGVGFNQSTSKRVYFMRGHATFNVTDPKSRYDKLLQPEVISYIKNNINKLNPWFYSEAKKRGIIQ